MQQRKKKRVHYAILIIWVCLMLHVPQLYARNQAAVHIWQGTNEHADVEMIPYLPATESNGMAVIICPGGSYFWLDCESEGEMVARWLNDAGIAAFLLKYRTAGVGAFITLSRTFVRGKQYPDMIRDVQRAIQLVRSNSDGYGIDPARIGVMGFSAGGHLALSSAMFSGTNYLAPLSITDTTSLRPDFVAAIYPVVTFSDKRYVHKRSLRGLLGERPKYRKALRDSLSIEQHVAGNCPPVFLVNCVDDPTVDYHNSILLDSVLTRKQVPHTYIQYQTGGHGFGANASKGTPESRQWKEAFLGWVGQLFDKESTDIIRYATSE